MNRYLKGDANETESALVDAWYKSYRSDEEVIQIESLTKEQAKQRFRVRINEKKQPEKIIKLFPVMLIKVAATILLICSTGLLFYTLIKPKFILKDQYTVIQTGIGSLKRITLPDNSEVWLNTSSRIRIPEKFRESTREVFLEEGEAFFQVKKNPKQPFIVHASALNVRVLGTSFNVRSYDKIADQKVFVKTGKVNVSRGKELLGTLVPGEQLSYNKATEKTELNRSKLNHLASWKDGFIYLEQAQFNELAMVLRNTYGLQLQAGSSKVRSYQFTLLLSTSQPIDKTLSMISMIHNTHYRKEGNDIIIY